MAKWRVEYVLTYNGGTLDDVQVNMGDTGDGYNTFDAISVIVTSMGTAVGQEDELAFGLGTVLTAWEIYELYNSDEGGS